jgi:nicotinate-nucleotide--dimethylbenzimidazole phosphoribosyltransferase
MAEFRSFDDLRQAIARLPSPHLAAAELARARQQLLTKPPGSLGRLEDMAVWLAGWQGRDRPRLERCQALVFAGNHGIAQLGVSAYPAAVTAQMVANFERGGAAINQLAEAAGARLDVHALELDRPTADFTIAPAMGEAECLAALERGMLALDRDADLVLLGEMGIGNTTVAAALCVALFGGAVEGWIGRGTGVDEAGLARKTEVVALALQRHGPALADPLAALVCCGGREQAAIFGAVLAARRAQIPVLLDGFVCTAAAAPLARLRADGLDHCLAGHVSAEAGHRRLLDALGLRPVLDLGMRLGEGSGAAVALAVLRAALAAHNGMATFAEAGVSERDG